MTDLIAIVAGSADHAAKLRNHLDREQKTFRVIFPGQNIRGLRFSHILMSEMMRENMFFASHAERERLEEWLGDLECRRAVGCPPPIYV